MAKKKADPASKDGATLPLFYKNPVPLDANAHANLALRANFGFNFAKGINAVPLNLIEMPQICHFYPIAFSPDGNATPVAILGLRDDENLFAREDGTWEEAYVPSYIRRYPFIFSEIPGGDQLTLCVDNVPEVVEEGGKQKFFDKDGQPTTLANNALEFCKSYHAAAQQTSAFSDLINELDLLVEREAQVNAGSQRINFSGFKIIDEEKLANLDDKAFLKLRAAGFLPFIYAHLFSGAQWQRLSQLLTQRMAA